jgi:predicted NUDIX family phosphoesterase
MKNENIIVIEKKKLFKDTALWQGFKKVDYSFYENINNNYQVYQRNLAEEDFNFKQIIPYMIFKYKNYIFCMQRNSSGGEKRLYEKYTIGIGGHIKKEDIKSNNIVEWGIREFNEEIEYYGEYNSTKIIGCINDELTDVGKVHIGILILIEGNTNKISVKSELKKGKMMNINELKEHENKMEYWSSIALKELIHDNLI